MPEFDMTYNTQKELLIIAEYGRNIQQLINHAKTIEDDEERQQYAESIVSLMNQMVPQANKDIDETNEKLWRHLFRIANHELDVVAPSGIQYTHEQANIKPDKVSYPHQNVRFRHYGSNIHRMIDKALAMEDEEKKMGFAYVIGSYMKLAYKTWNREHYVSDDIIKEDLQTLSNGQLVLEDETSFKTPNFTPSRGRRPSAGRNTGGRGRNNRNSGGRGRNNRNTGGSRRRR